MSKITQKLKNFVEYFTDTDSGSVISVIIWIKDFVKDMVHGLNDAVASSTQKRLDKKKEEEKNR